MNLPKIKEHAERISEAALGLQLAISRASREEQQPDASALTQERETRIWNNAIEAAMTMVYRHANQHPFRSPVNCELDSAAVDIKGLFKPTGKTSCDAGTNLVEARILFANAARTGMFATPGGNFALDGLVYSRLIDLERAWIRKEYPHLEVAFTVLMGEETCRG